MKKRKKEKLVKLERRCCFVSCYWYYRSSTSFWQYCQSE